MSLSTLSTLTDSKNEDLYEQDVTGEAEKSNRPKETEYLICGCYDGTIQIWDLKEKRKLNNLSEDQNIAVYCLCILSDQQLASGSCNNEKNEIKIWSLDTFELIQTLGENQIDGIVFSLTYLANLNYLINGSQTNTINIWKRNKENRKFNLLQTLNNIHSDSVNALITLPVNSFASASTDKSIKIWNFNTQADVIRTMNGHEKSIRCLIHLSNDPNDGYFIASGSDDKTVRIWNYLTGVQLHTFNLAESNRELFVYSLAQLKNDDLFAIGSTSNQIKIRNRVEETNERTLSGHLGKVYCLTKLSNDHLASGSIDRKIKVWNITNENLDQTLNTIPASQVLSIVRYYKI